MMDDRRDPKRVLDETCCGMPVVRQPDGRLMCQVSGDVWTPAREKQYSRRTLTDVDVEHLARTIEKREGNR